MTPDDTPLLIFHGEDDKTVLPGQSQHLYDVAKAAGLEASIQFVPKAAHEIGPFLTPSIEKTVVEFLDKHLR